MARKLTTVSRSQFLKTVESGYRRRLRVKMEDKEEMQGKVDAEGG